MRQIRSVRTIMALALALALLGAPGAQAAELYFEGKVAGGETLSVLAPYGGIVEEMAVSVGERIEQGDLIAKLALLVAIAFPAYTFSRGLSIVWRVIFWIALVIYILGCVLGMLSINLG